MAFTYLVRVKPGKKVRDNDGGVRVGGEEFELTHPVRLKSSALEILKEISASEPTPPVSAPVEAKPLRGEEQVLESNPDPTPTSEQTVAAQAAVINTAEGSQIIDSFPMGSNPNPALLKAKIQEVEKAEATGTLKVEDGGGAPAGERFQIVKKSGAWQNVVDTETGQVLNEKGMKMEDALAFKSKLIESANPPTPPSE